MERERKMPKVEPLNMSGQQVGEIELRMRYLESNQMRRLFTKLLKLN